MRTSNSCCAFVSLLGVLMCGTVLTSAIWADDLDQQLLESLEGDRQPDSLVTIVNRLLDNTQRAQVRLAETDFDEQTQSVQQQILDDIDALLRQTTSPPNNSPPAGEAQSQPPNADDSQASQSQQAEGDGAPNPETDGESTPDAHAKSRESAERTAQAEGSAAEQERRLGLATAAWGHLPPKLREQMRSAFSETYLPEYDDLVRRYYESLAARRESRENGPAAP